MEHNGNYRSSALFYDFYNIYKIIVFDLISAIYNTNQFFSSCLLVNTFPDIREVVNCALVMNSKNINIIY